MLVSILGPVRIERDGEMVSLGPRLQRLLAALVSRRGSVISADALAELVWDGSPPEARETTLRSYITRLRHALASDAPALVFRQSGYELLTDEIEIDADLFEREVNDAFLAVQTADQRSADLVLERALARWAGRPYGELGDEDWARPERIRLEERRIEALEARVEIMIADGRSERAVAEASQLAEQLPLRERPLELLMRALYASGRRAEAVRAFRQYRELLVDETGLDPSAELSELESEMLAGELPRSQPAGRVRSYELGEVIGRGAFSVVHRAVQPGVARDVAVKIIRAELVDHPDFVRRFEREAQLAATVEHPHAVPLYDFWRQPGAAFLVMRWMRGGNLAEVLRARGPISREQLVRTLDQAGGALHAAHRSGIVHRDVRPANLLLDEDGTTYLCDFGIALASTIDLSTRPVHYASPELLRDQPVDVATDIHSLGVTVYELLTGRLPLADTTDRAELIDRQLTEPLPSVRATRTDLPLGIDDVLARATSKVASERQSTVPEFVDDVESVLGVGSGRRRGGTRPAIAAQPNPYVGLHAFTEADADRFHGRDRLIGEIADAIDVHRLVAVVGPSGSGKSSVVRAGLVPALRRGAVPGSDTWFVTTMFPGTDPIDALETALLRVAVNPPSSLRSQLDEDGGLLRAVRRVLPDDDATVLVVIDQFEELFTVVQMSDRRERFLVELARAIEAPDSPLRVIATLRADHYDAPLRNHALAQLVTDGTITVRPMRADELEQAIVEPARSAGVEVESALVTELVAGVTDRPAALPLLQFALTELYDRRVTGTMRLETHHSIGGLAGALAARADRLLERGDDDDRQLARQIFSRLVTFGDDTQADTRRRAPLHEFDNAERTAWVISEFVSARLLVLDRDDESREPTVEVAHEALLRDWPRLTRWIDEDRADLRVRRIITTAAADWEASERDDGLLARGGRLELVKDLSDRRSDLLNDSEHEWVHRSRSLADAEAKRRRRYRQRLLASAAVIVVVAVAGAAVALILRGQAIDNERAAEQSRALAQARELIFEAEAALDEDPERAVLLGIEAAGQFESAGQAVPSSATVVIREGMTANRIVGRLPGGRWVSASSDGTTLVTTDSAGAAVLWDWRSQERVGAVELRDGYEHLQSWFAGDQLVSIARTGPEAVALLIGGATGTDAEVVVEGIGNDEWVDWTPSLDTIFRLRSGDLTAWTMGPQPTVVARWAAVDTFVIEGDHLALGRTVGDVHEIALIDLDTGSERTLDIDSPARALAISPDLTKVAVSSDRESVTVYEIESGAVVWSAQDLSIPRLGRWVSQGDVLLVGSVGETALVNTDTGVADFIDVHDSGTDFNVQIPGTRLIASTSQAGTEIVIYRMETFDGLTADVSIGRPVWLAPTADGDLALVDDSDIATFDPADGTELAVQRGSVDSFFGPFGPSMPNFAGDTAFVSIFDDRARLQTVGPDPETVWVAPEGWTLRGIDTDASRVLLIRYEGDDVLAKIVSLARADDGSMTAGPEVELPEPPALAWLGEFSPDGELVMVTGAENALYTADGIKVHHFSDGFGAFVSEFTPDGSTLVVAAVTGELFTFDVQRLLDGATTEESILVEVQAHANRALAQLSPDGSMIASTATASPARLWDVSTGEQIAEFGSGESEALITFHPTEDRVYVWEAGVLTTHSLNTDDLLQLARESATRSLTAAECERYLRRPCDA